MKYVISLVFLILSSSAALAATCCPEQSGKLPKLVIEVGEYRMFYFSNSLSSDGEQVGDLIVKKGNQLISSEINIDAYADWYSDLDVQGSKAGFQVDSQNFSLIQAWVIKDGQKKIFQTGKSRKLNCR